MSRLSAHTKRKLDGAIDEVKRDKFAALVLLFDQEVGAVEVLCSETNNPMIVAEMARAALEGLTRSAEDGRKESLVH
jgi:hypothetical protein